jgi:hypothetical protein
VNFAGGASTALNMGNSSGVTNISGKLGIAVSPSARLHVYESTNNAEIVRHGVAKGSGLTSDPLEQEYFFSDTTNSVLLKQVLAFSTTASETYLVEFRASWENASHYGTGVYMGTYRNSGGTVALVGTLTTVHQQLVGTAIPSIIASSSTIKLNWQGVVGQTIRWTGKAKILTVKQ